MIAAEIITKIRPERMTAKVRSLTSEERKNLQATGSASEKRGLLAAHGFGSLLLVAVLFTGISLLWKPLASIVELPERSDIKWWLLLACTLVVFFCMLPSFWRGYLHADSSDSYGRKIDADLLAGVASIEVLEVNEVYEIEEFEDEGAGFLLSLGDGRVLFLIGQDLYPYSVKAEPEDREFADTVFPNTQIEHTYAPHSGFVFSTRGLGNYLRPKAILQWPERGPRLEEFLGPYPDSFLDGPVDNIVSRAGFERVPL